jgi:hypothetical protein
MKKLVLFTLIFLNFSVVSSFADQRIIVDKIAKSDAEQIELTIPKETKPGPGKVTIEIINDDGSVAGTAFADFCKDLDGFIHWNEPCEDMDPLLSLTELEAIIQRDKLPNYDPAQEPAKNSKNMLAGLAALALIGSKKEDEEEAEKEELEFVKGGDLEAVDDEAKWGDLSGSWDHRFTEEIDFAMISLAERTGSRSPLFSRKVADGSYLRAMFGSFSTILYPIALILGAHATTSVHFQAIPPKWYLVAAILVISTFDGFAGFISATVFFVATVVTGHVTYRSELMTVLGMGILMVAPAMIASSIRPLRRAAYRDQKWERLTDYALITLLSGWTIKGVVSALNTLAHTQFALSFHATRLGFIVSGAVLLRLLLEDLAVRAYPVRLSITMPNKVKQTEFDQRISKLWKIYIFFIVASGYVGINIKLVIGTAIFFLPSFIDMLGDKFEHRIKFFYWMTPRGASKIIVMIFIGGGFAAWMQGIFTSPRLFLAWSFAVLTIPGFVIQLIALFAEAPKEDWKKRAYGHWVYKVGGVGVFFLLILMVSGVDLFDKFKSLIGM